MRVFFSSKVRLTDVQPANRSWPCQLRGDRCYSSQRWLFQTSYFQLQHMSYLPKICFGGIISIVRRKLNRYVDPEFRGGSAYVPPPRVTRVSVVARMAENDQTIEQLTLIANQRVANATMPPMIDTEPIRTSLLHCHMMQITMAVVYIVCAAHCMYLLRHPPSRLFYQTKLCSHSTDMCKHRALLFELLLT